MDSPKHKHHYAFIILIGVLLVAFIVAVAINGGFSENINLINNTTAPQTQTSTPMDDSAQIQRQKTSILNRIDKAQTDPLSESEKNSLFQQIGGNKMTYYGFTDEETQRILNAFNATSSQPTP